MRHDFSQLRRLPPYVLAEVTDLKHAGRRAGEDIIDLGMGNPDLPTPPHVVEKICEAARNPRNHRYSSSRGVPNLRRAASEWYQRNHGVEIDPDGEAIAVIGAKEGLSHFVLVTIGPGDVVLAPDPTYPIHQYSVIMAGGDLRYVPLTPDEDFLDSLETAIHRTWPKPKVLILSFPHNPTTRVVELGFFERIVALAKEHEMMVIHDFAYAEVCFDGYKPPSILEVPGARDVAIEFVSLSKSHSMAGWRVGFAAGNREMIHALGRIKSYLDYGMPQAIQIGAIVALRGPQDIVAENTAIYRERRDVLIDGLG
ncbi:MAG: aminotransferase class I/II-fold pyridoxal phosphate-dependent enzyme, partial [Myxococcota bacterium]